MGQKIHTCEGSSGKTDYFVFLALSYAIKYKDERFTYEPNGLVPSAGVALFPHNGQESSAYDVDEHLGVVPDDETNVHSPSFRETNGLLPKSSEN